MDQQKISINICGFGFVGSAHAHLCERNNVEFNVCDLQQKEGNFNYFNNLQNLVNFSEINGDINFYVICVPTPCDSEGNCDTSIVKSVLEQLNKTITKETYVIIKSTVIPTTCSKLNEEYPELNIVFCPEFLRENSYKDDIYNAQFVLIGISPKFNMDKYKKILEIIRVFYKHNTQIDILMRSYEECELFKYTVNNFLAVKVWYFNKIYDISESLNIDYQKFKTLFQLEPRISGYGVKVPGDHGRGYAGSCLLKDQDALIKLSENLDIDSSVLKSISNENKQMRKK